MNHLFEHHFLKTQLDKLDLPTPLIVRENEPVAATIERMSKEGNSCTLVVCKDGTPSGIFTERDVVKKVALNEDKTLTLQISDVMTRNPITVRSSVSVARALYEMSLGGFRHLPIIAGATPKLRILSTEEVIDFVYLHLTKRIADRPTDNLGRSSIEEFFRADISVLRPSTPILMHEEQPIEVAVRRLMEKNIGAVMLTSSSKQLTGIFTERDYLLRVAGERLKPQETPIKNVMTRKPKTLLENASLSLAFNMMSEGKFRHIPIVDHLEELVATVSVRNFISFLNKEIMHELETHK